MATTPMHGGHNRLTITAGSGGVDEGQFVVATALTSQQILADASTGVADGIAVESVDAGQKTTMVMMVPGTVMEVLAEAGVTAGSKVGVSANGKASLSAGATLATGTVGANNAITWTAKEGVNIATPPRITIVDPAGNNGALAVDVDGRDIIVTSATDGASAISSTAADVIAAILEHDAASQMVSAASTGASTGLGLVLAVAQTALASGVNPTIGRALTATSGGTCVVLFS